MYHLKTSTLSSWNIIFEEIKFSGIYEVTAEKIVLQYYKDNAQGVIPDCGAE